MKIELEFTPEYNEDELRQSIKDAIVDKMIVKYMDTLEESFAKKLELMLLTEAGKIVKGMSKIPVEKCNTNGVKETMTMEQFIIKTATESLTKRVDSSGRSDGYNSSDKKTPIEWFVDKTIKDADKAFMSELNSQIVIIQEKYQKSLEDMVTKTLAPLYNKLRKQVKA